MCSSFFKTIVSVVLLCLSSEASAELVFSAPPRESPEKSATIYGPMADAMSGILGQSVNYKHPGSWSAYARDMRAGSYDLVLDEPHFGAWRIKHLGHTPLVRLPGELAFAVVTRNRSYTTLKDLVGKKFCALASPEMGTLTVQHMYANPSRQPVFTYTRGDFSSVFSAMMAGKCDASVLPHAFYTRTLSQAQRDKIQLIKVSAATPNQTLTASPNLSEGARESLITIMADPANAGDYQGVFNHFSKTDKMWMETDPTAYTDLNLLLEGHAWGWVVKKTPGEGF